MRRRGAARGFERARSVGGAAGTGCAAYVFPRITRRSNMMFAG
jgi:hypothetical protein